MFEKLKKSLLYFLLFYAILGFILIPLILKPQMIDLVQSETNAKIKIDDIYFNPFTFRLEFADMDLRSLDDKELVSIKRIILNLQISSLLRGAVHIRDFIVQEPRISLVLNKDKKINFTSILKPSPKKSSDKSKSSNIPRIIVNRIAVVDGSMNYEDYTRKTKFEFGLDSIGFELKDIDTKDLTKSDASVRFYTLLADGGFVDLKTQLISMEPLILKGSLEFEASKLYTQWRYMKDSLNLEVADGKLSLYTDYYFNVDDLESATLSNLSVDLDKLRVKPKELHKDILNIKSLQLSGGEIKPIAQDIHLEKIALNGMDLKAKRDKKGDIDWLDYIKTLPKDSDKTDQKEPLKKDETKPWKVLIDKVALNNVNTEFKDTAFNALVTLSILDLDGIELNTKSKEEDFRVKLKKALLKESEFSFEDKTLRKSVTNKINNIKITATDIDSKEDSWLQYTLEAKVNNKGSVKSSGSVRHTPLKQEGDFELSKISLKELTPYLKEQAYIYIDDGYLSLKAKAEYEKSIKKPDLRVNGSFKLEEVFVNDSRDKSSLVSFNKVDIKKFTLETSPDRLYIDRIDLKSFYVNAIIDKNKNMNLASLAKVKKIKKQSLKQKAKKSKVFPVKIAKIKVTDGSAYFSDLSLPIKFKTNIHDLNGVIHSVSSMKNETSNVDIVGEIDKYGSTKLKGSVNSVDPKTFTDLAFNFRNLDLSSMSGYSGSFAGYKIDDGKLFLNLNYKIDASKLIGENSIIIKKIQLGDRIENETNSSLPLGFVIALLEDSDGVIDIDMPVRGNLDEPDFKYGALVVETFAKLILKAVASPFTFLGAILGVDGDKLKYAEFEAGSVKILPSEKEKLDNVAKLMIKRPKISLSIGGTYNTEIDKASMQKTKLIDLVAKLSGAKNEEKKINAKNIELLEDIYKDARDDDKLDKLEDALEKKYDGDEFKRAYLQALIKECSSIQEVSQEEIHTLAKNRVDVIKSYLVDMKGIDPSKISELDISDVLVDENELIKTKLEVTVK